MVNLNTLDCVVEGVVYRLAHSVGTCLHFFLHILLHSAENFDSCRDLQGTTLLTMLSPNLLELRYARN